MSDDLPEVSVRWLTTNERRQQIGALLVRATEAIVADGEQSADSARWYRGDWDAIQRHRDGITIDAQGQSQFTRVLGKMVPTARETNDRYWLDATENTHTETAAAYGILTVSDPYDRHQQLQGGRLWQRMHLWGTNHGLAMHPMNQMTERIDRKRSLSEQSAVGRELVALIDPDEQALLTFRLGFPTDDALASPRRAATEVVL